MLENYVARLSKDLDFDEPLIPDNQGHYTLSFEDGVTVVMSDAPGGLNFYCQVAALPDQVGEEFLIELLSANLFGQVTHHSVLGLSSDGKWIVLSRTIEHKINYNEFRNLLEDFTNAADFWHNEAAVDSM